MMQLLEASREVMTKIYRDLAWSDFLHSPPIDVALNLVDFSLQSMLFQASSRARKWEALWPRI